MTHLTMYGRGHFNRMRGVVAPPPRPVLHAYPKAAPAQEYPADDPRVVVTAIGMLGDALTDAIRAARDKVNTEAANYALPRIPTTRSEAIMAYILLMRSAKAEHPANAGTYTTLANNAAYTFRNSPLSTPLANAKSQLVSAPRTQRVAADILAAMPGGAVAPTPTPTPKVKKWTESTKLRVSTDAEPAVETPGESWQDKLAMLPAWAPWVAGGVVVAAAAWLLLPRKAPPPVAAAVKP